MSTSVKNRKLHIDLEFKQTLAMPEARKLQKAILTHHFNPLSDYQIYEPWAHQAHQKLQCVSSPG